jgi:hypothetical protein
LVNRLSNPVREAVMLSNPSISFRPIRCWFFFVLYILRFLVLMMAAVMLWCCRGCAATV